MRLRLTARIGSGFLPDNPQDLEIERTVVIKFNKILEWPKHGSLGALSKASRLFSPVQMVMSAWP